MYHNMLTPYVYPYTMHVSSIPVSQVDSINLTPLKINLTPTKHSSANR